MKDIWPLGARVARVVIIGATLAGCATAAQRQAAAIRTNNQDAIQHIQVCTRAVYDDPIAEPLHKHMPYLVKDATLEQLTDASLATDDEIKILLAIHPRNTACRQAFLDQIDKATPTFVPILTTEYYKSEDSLIDLIQKKQSWGQHIRRVRDITNDATAQLTAEGRRIDAGLAQANQAELDRRQAAFNSMAQYLQTQEIINNMNRPVVTNCNAFGTTVNCISH